MKILHVAPRYGWWGLLEPDCLDNERSGRQVGGGEAAMFQACFQLAARGHEVTCAFRCRPGRYRDVEFVALQEAEGLAHAGQYDAVVSWDDASFLAGVDAKKRILSVQLNDVDPAAALHAQRIVSPSRHHARFLSTSYGIPFEQFDVIPNRVDLGRLDFSLERDPLRVYYASSPDRGLHHLLRLWKDIERQVPGAHLHVYYEVGRWYDGVLMAEHYRPTVLGHVANRVRYWQDRVGPSVVFEGAVHPHRLGREACSSAVLAYPCDPIVYTEGYGTSVLEAYAAGACPIVTDADAFSEVYRDQVPLTSCDGLPNPLLARDRIAEDFGPRVVEALRAMQNRRAWAWRDPAQAAEVARALSWKTVGPLWEAVVETST